MYRGSFALLAPLRRRGLWCVVVLLVALVAHVTANAESSHVARGIPRFELTVLLEGDGSGTVTSAFGAIDCGATCSNTFDANTAITLTAHADDGSTFTGWSGGPCEEGDATLETCQLTMRSNVTITAHFDLKVYSVSVSKMGEGKGSIVAETPDGVCALKAPCIFTTTFGSEVALHAAAFPSTGSRFAGWQGDCGGSEPTCKLTITQTTSITGVFGLAEWSLAVTTSGKGVVRSNPAGIDCGEDDATACAAIFVHGTKVQLVASPASGYKFSGWTAFCSGTGNCAVPMTQSRIVQAIFEDETFVDPEPEYRAYLSLIFR